MKRKLGFTLIEVLVVIVVIAIIALLAYPSYRRGRVTSQNEMARSKLMEVANAARMYNEDARGEERVAGGFGQFALDGFAPSTRLFTGTATHAGGAVNYLNRRDWNSAGTCTGDEGSTCIYHYRGYNFYVCNPDSTNGSNQPHSSCDGRQIATMTGPAAAGGGVNADAISEYGGHTWWVSTENLGAIGSNYGAPPVTSIGGG